MARILIRQAHGGATRIISDPALPYFLNQGYVVLETLDDDTDASPLYLSAAEGDLRWAKISDLGDPESAEVAVISEAVADSEVLRAAFGLGMIDVVRDHGAKVDGVTDDTAAWQAAINAAVAAGGGTIYCPKPGRSMIKGAQQTGTAQGYNYSAQLLLPARPYSAGRISVVIAGPCPPPLIPTSDTPTEPPTPTGLVLLSTATGGNVLDAIPAVQTTGSGWFGTDVHLVLRDLTVLTQQGSAANAINAQVVDSLQTHNLLVGRDSGGTGSGSTLGATSGIIAPHQNNGAHVDLRNTSVNYFGTGIKLSEHARLDNVSVQGCTTALRVYGVGGGHVIEFTKVLVQGCATVLACDTTNYPQSIIGTIDIEGIGVTMMIDDPNSLLAGELTIYNAHNPTAGWPARGAQNLRLRNWWTSKANGGFVSNDGTPWDTFTRDHDVAGLLGAADLSRHIWRNSATLAGAWTTDTGKAKATTFQAGVALSLCSHYPRWGGASRMLTGVFELPASGYDVGLALDFMQNDYMGLVVGLIDGQVQIKRYEGGGYLSLASSAAGVLTGGATRTLQVVATEPRTPGGARTVSAYVDGATSPAVTYTLTAPIIADLAEPAPTRIKRDGLYAGSSDTVSRCTLFRVDPLGA